MVLIRRREKKNVSVYTMDIMTTLTNAMTSNKYLKQNKSKPKIHYNY